MREDGRTVCRERPRSPNAAYRAGGFALIIVVTYLSLVTLVAATFLGLLHQSISAQHRTEAYRSNMHLAEAGLDKALEELRQHPGEYRGETNTPLGAGRFSVEARPGKAQGAYRITATGERTHAGHVTSRAQIEAEVSLAPDGRVRELRWTEVKRP